MNQLLVKDFIELSDNCNLTTLICNNSEDIRVVNGIVDGKNTSIHSNNVQTFYGKNVTIFMDASLLSLRKLVSKTYDFLGEEFKYKKSLSYGVENSYSWVTLNKDKYGSSMFDMISDMESNDHITFTGYSKKCFDVLKDNRNGGDSKSKAWSEIRNYVVRYFPFIDIYLSSSANTNKRVIPTSNGVLYRDEHFIMNCRGLSSKDRTTDAHYYVHFKTSADDETILDKRLMKLYGIECLATNIVTRARNVGKRKVDDVTPEYLGAENNYVLGIFKFASEVFPDLSVNDVQVIHHFTTRDPNPSVNKFYRNIHCQKLKERVLCMHDMSLNVIKDSKPMYPPPWVSYF